MLAVEIGINAHDVKLALVVLDLEPAVADHPVVAPQHQKVVGTEPLLGLKLLDVRFRDFPLLGMIRERPRIQSNPLVLISSHDEGLDNAAFDGYSTRGRLLGSSSRGEARRYRDRANEM